MTDDDFPDGLDLGEDAGDKADDGKPTRRWDPAEIAASVLIMETLRRAGLQVAQAAADGVVCLITVPSAEWVTPVLGQWEVKCRRGARPADGFMQRHDWDRWTWAAWSMTSQPSPSALSTGEARFALMVANGAHCLGVAPATDWLPVSLVGSADVRLDIRALSGTDVEEIVSHLCGERPSSSISDEDANRLTPHILRLARRPRQSAAQYVAKLRQLLDWEAKASARQRDASPRAAPTLDRLPGMKEAVEWGLRLARDLAAYQRREIPWATVDRGCLLSGPPGCGKTTFARALAATCGIPLVTGSYGVWHSAGQTHQGEFLKAMRGAFREAREKAPSILFIDEIESFPDRNTVNHRWREYEIQVVNTLLAEIDGVEDREGVILIGACNAPERLDPALVRSGRLDRHIRILLPDRAALEAILREHLGQDLEGEHLGQVSAAAVGASGADCERYVRGARRRAREAGRPMKMDDLLAEIGGTPAPDHVRYVLSVHEAGHAVATCVLFPGTLQGVTLRQTQDQGGLAVASIESILFPEHIHLHLVCALAGRAAEEFMFNRPSSGAGGRADCDLSLATMLATRAAMAYCAFRSIVITDSV